MFFESLQQGMNKALSYLQSPDFTLSDYKYIGIQCLFKTTEFDVWDELVRSNISFPDDETIIIKEGGGKNLVSSIGIVSYDFIIMFSVLRTKSGHHLSFAYDNGIRGAIPLQFSKENMLNVLSREWPSLELWEYRSKKSKAQAYIKDESEDKHDIKERLEEDKKRGLKPYFASYKLRGHPKKYSFSIYGNGVTIVSAEEFPEVIDNLTEIIDQLISYEGKAMNFVKEVKLTPGRKGLPYVSRGAKIQVGVRFDAIKLKQRLRKELEVNITSKGKNDSELVVYDKKMDEYLSITALENTVYIFPRTTRDSKQENLVANLTYVLDELFGLIQG